MQKKVPSRSKPSEKECVTPRGHGGGDGIRQNISARKRLPISSARKFNARTPRDETLVLKLEAALDKVGARKKKDETGISAGHPKFMVKSASVAEITPSKAKRRLSLVSTDDDSYEIYATPRPFSHVPKKLFCLHERNACKVYKKLMLLAWRSTRNRGERANDLLKRQEIHASQLQLQVDVLSNLRVSESQKREDAQNECQKLNKAIGILELENNQLNEETQSLQTCLEVLQNELKVAKAENNFLSEQSIKMQDLINKKNSEKRSLEEKVEFLEQDLSSQNASLSLLEQNFQNTEKKLQTVELNFRIKERKYAQLKCEFKKQLDANRSVSLQLQSLEEDKLNISSKVDDLESQLNHYIQSCEQLKDVNDELVQEVRDMSIELQEEKKRSWLTNTKQIALLSLSALQKIAYVVIPAYMDGPTNF